MLKLFLFGPPRIERGGRRVDLGLRKAMALLAYLAVSNQPHTREAMATMLWPDASHSAALGRLRRAVHRITHTLGADILTATPESLEINRDRGLGLDVEEFRSEVALGREAAGPEAFSRLAHAAELYVDHFLAGFTLPDSFAFDEWQFFQAESLRRALDQVLKELVTFFQAQGEWEPAISHARRRLMLDPLEEAAHTDLMMLYAQAGEQAAALRQYEHCRRVLKAELGVAPKAETSALYHTIRAKELLAQPSPPVPNQAVVGAGRKPSHNLPLHLHPFVGRVQELAHVRHLLVDCKECRLLTLAGPGGTGKTRLAIEASRGVLGAFPDGVFFVCLASVSCAEDLLSAVAEQVGMPPRDRLESREQLFGYISDKCMLLLLDNVDDLLPQSSLVAEMLQAAPHLKILVTSCERLNLVGESVYVLGGMTTPEEGAAVDIESSDAVQMLMQLAELTHPGLDLDAVDLEQAARICRLVQGMPLALVLAVGWLDVLSFREIADEIAQNLDFLETPLRDVPERHRSVRAAFQHAWRRLGAEDQQVYRRLSVFRGGFTRQAARQVAEAGPRTLRRLSDKSLISVRGARYQAHELLRRFAAESLEASDEQERAQALHSKYYLRWTVQLRLEDKRGETWQAAMAEIDAELRNIRAAWSWALRQGDEAAVRQSAEALRPFFAQSHRKQEADRFLDAFRGDDAHGPGASQASGKRGLAPA